MEQLNDFADSRLINGCIYCGGSGDTREHVPSKVFLDSPFPENLPVVGACRPCNNGFSADEEYVACLIESVVSGSTDPEQIRRPNVSKLLRQSPRLRERIEASKSVKDGQVQFEVEAHRIENVLLKLARGHAVYELSQPCREEPTFFWWCPIDLMTEEEREDFNASHVVQFFGEIGSRGMQRLLVTRVTLKSAAGELSTVDLVINDWLEVQEGRYRYLAVDDRGGIRIKLVIGEYLACEVIWETGS